MFGGRTTCYGLISSGDLETLRVRGRRIVTPEQIEKCKAKLLQAAEGTPTVDPEVSKQKAAAGRKGRAEQIAKREAPALPARTALSFRRRGRELPHKAKRRVLPRRFR